MNKAPCGAIVKTTKTLLYLFQSGLDLGDRIQVHFNNGRGFSGEGFQVSVFAISGFALHECKRFLMPFDHSGYISFIKVLTGKFAQAVAFGLVLGI